MVSRRALRGIADGVAMVSVIGARMCARKGTVFENSMRMKPIPRTWSVTQTVDGLCGRQKRAGMYAKPKPEEGVEEV